MSSSFLDGNRILFSKIPANQSAGRVLSVEGPKIRAGKIGCGLGSPLILKQHVKIAVACRKFFGPLFGDLHSKIRYF